MHDGHELRCAELSAYQNHLERLSDFSYPHRQEVSRASRLSRTLESVTPAATRHPCSPTGGGRGRQPQSDVCNVFLTKKTSYRSHSRLKKNRQAPHAQQAGCTTRCCCTFSAHALRAARTTKCQRAQEYHRSAYSTAAHHRGRRHKAETTRLKKNRKNGKSYIYHGSHKQVLLTHTTYR